MFTKVSLCVCVCVYVCACVCAPKRAHMFVCVHVYMCALQVSQYSVLETAVIFDSKLL